MSKIDDDDDSEDEPEHRGETVFCPRMLTAAEGKNKAEYLFWHFLEMLWFKRSNRGRYDWIEKGRDE